MESRPENDGIVLPSKKIKSLASEINKLGLGALAFGHMVVDMQTSSLAVLIPLLYVTLQLNYATAALIVTINNVTSSIIQPIFGLISDRTSLRWLLPLGCLLAALGLVLVLFMPGYGMVLLAVTLSGLGSAAYHPEATRNANYVSGERKAAGFSFFFVGGNLGFALGPILMTLLLAFFGHTGTFGMLVPGALGCLVLWYLLPLYAKYDPKRHQADGTRKATGRPASPSLPRRTLIWALSLLIGILCIRSLIQIGLITFIPLYFNEAHGYDKTHTALLLSTFVFSGSIGTLIGGPLADRLNRKFFMISSLAFVTPFLLLALYSTGWLQIIALAIAGGTLIISLSVPVVMAQELLPNNVGLASGLALGFAFGAGGLGAAAVGAYANSFGLDHALFLLALAPLLAILFSALVPNKQAPQMALATE